MSKKNSVWDLGEDGWGVLDVRNFLLYNDLSHRYLQHLHQSTQPRPYFLKGKEVRAVDEMNSMQQDHIMMQDGRVMIMRNGARSPMDHEMTMPDGTKVMIDGTMMMPDGTTRMMAEGETILLQGETQNVPTSPENMSDRQFKESM
jgi:hypothetical protein